MTLGSDRTCERGFGRAEPNRRFHGCRRIRVVKAGAVQTVPGSTPFAQIDLAPGCSCAWRLWAAAPLATAPSTIRQGTPWRRNVTAFGVPEHGPGMPRVFDGRAPSTPDRGRGVEHAGPKPRRRSAWVRAILRIVGTCPASQIALAKIPNIFLTTEGLQQLAYNGQPTIARSGSTGCPDSSDGYQTVNRCCRDLMRPLKVAVDAITAVGGLAVDRCGVDRRLGGLPLRWSGWRDFAVFARSAPTRLTGRALVRSSSRCSAQVGIPAVAGAVVPDDCRYPAFAALIPAIATVIGLLASVAGLRRVAAIDPALAFGGPQPGGPTISDLVVEYSSGGYSGHRFGKPDAAPNAGDLAWPSGCGRRPLVLPRRHLRPVRLNRLTMSTSRC